MATKHLAPTQENEASAYREAKEKARKEYAGLSLDELVKRFNEGYKKKEEAENALHYVNGFFDVLRFEAIPDAMDAKNITSINYEGIGRLGLTADLSMSVADKPGMFAWLKKAKMGDLIQQTVNSSTLKSWYKDRMKKGKSVPPAELLKVNPVTRASITKG